MDIPRFHPDRLQFCCFRKLSFHPADVGNGDVDARTVGRLMKKERERERERERGAQVLAMNRSN